MMGTTNRNAPGEIGVSRGLTWKVVAPMQHHSIPNTTPSSIIVDGDVALIPLRSKTYPDLFATIDYEDIPLVGQYKWYPRKKTNNFHVRRTYRTGPNVITVYLHTDILGTPPDGMVIDHINGNGLDNRKENLRFATPQQNHWNSKKTRSSKYQGVSFVKEIGLWQARIRLKGIYVHLGYHRSDVDAARAYDFAASRLQGEFAFLNFPEEVER